MSTEAKPSFNNMKSDFSLDTCSNIKTQLSDKDLTQLEKQNSRMVSQFMADKIERESRKHWDLFYKRNETRFFKDRHWTTREFVELAECESSEKTVLFEVGCGVGNLMYPLLEDGLNLFVYACDLSPRAVDFVKSHDQYSEDKVKAFQADITGDDLTLNVPEASVHIVSLIFVLSAIHPDKHALVLKNLSTVIRPGGKIIFRDYGLYDMAQLRFKPGHKIADNFYMRQDCTRSYFFSTEYLTKLATDCGFEVKTNSYVYRRTVNKKEDIDVPRRFVQAVFVKPTS
ncbi:tRNA N(3)-methylcytidine methyltransferase METTL6 isoform X2 [Nilaparvata lugens]|uniref:tRNA N(3)-methylcytidine methyltransferase METTL6 isoform X2 n=1 Tax=Nilaparvata lugens TaxID=108931 RepID=UPI00193D28EF|nr:tRNA N(3)-methylcytidine methyltransferase METTL6 isoform X2 [Nilaparvata lugens]